jgi:hypothetical protein
MEHLPVDPATQRAWNNLDTLMVAVENRAAVMITANPAVFTTRTVTFAKNTNQTLPQPSSGRFNKRAIQVNSTKTSTISRPATSAFTTTSFKTPVVCSAEGAWGQHAPGPGLQEQPSKQR